MSGESLFEILQRIDWMKEQLTTGRHWNMKTFVDEFQTSIRTGRRYLKIIRRLYGWKIGFDPRERTFYLDD